MATATVDPGVAKLQFQAKAATAFLAILSISTLFMDVATWIAGPADSGDSIVMGCVGLLLLVGFTGSLVFVGMWISRANRNLRIHGCDNLEITPGWAVGWYFVPFANLRKPFHAMREIWNASLFGGAANLTKSNSLLTRWWACWIVGNIASNSAFRLGRNADFDTTLAIDLVASLFFAAAAYSLCEIMTAVTRAQSDRLGVLEVFA